MDMQGGGTGGHAGAGNTGGERVYTISMASDEFQHEALLKELHQADNLLVSHSNLSVTITGAAIAFVATQLQNRSLIYGVAFCGVVFAVEWLVMINIAK